MALTYNPPSILTQGTFFYFEKIPLSEPMLVYENLIVKELSLDLSRSIGQLELLYIFENYNSMNRNLMLNFAQDYYHSNFQQLVFGL